MEPSLFAEKDEIMIGTGTIINSASIIAAGVIGRFTGRFFRSEQQDALNKACGVSILFIAVAGAMEGMLKVEGTGISSGKSMLVVLCLAIVGAIQDGLLGDYSTLALKSVLDFIIIAVMTSSMGKGCAFSAIPVFVFEGCITLLARLVSPVMTAEAISYLSLIGSVLIFCIGLNIVWDKKLRVANMLPSVLLAILAAYLPWSF